MSQTSTNWLTNGNNTSGSSYFGTNNNNPIIFKANGSEVFRLRPTGDVKIMQFDDNLYHGVVLTNKNGVLQKLNFGTSSQVLLGDGTWGTLPASRLSASCFSLAPFWTMGGDNFSTSLGVTEASIGTCNNYDFIIKANNTNSMWFKPDGTIGFGTNIPSNTGGKEFKFNDGALRLSGTNTYGGPMLVFDGGVSPYGDWGIEYAPSAFTKPGLNFWKPFGSSNANNYLLFLADDGMVGVGTANPNSRLTVDAWNDNGLTIQTVNTKKAISTYNKTTNKETFVVNADGKTIIGSAPATTDTMLVVNGTLKANDLNVNGTFSINKTLQLNDGIKIGFGTNAFDLKNYVINPTTNIIGLGIDSTSLLNYKSAASSSSTYYCGQNLYGGTFVKELTVLAPSTGVYQNHLSIQTDKVDGFINLVHPTTFASGSSLGVLRINENCSGGVNIAKGGGFVSTSAYFEIGDPVRNNLVSLNIKQLSFQTEAIKVTNNIGQTNFLVKSNGYVYAREINVMPVGIAFPDYVFSEKYKLMPLKDVEAYVKHNMHLPNIPSAAVVETDGINLSELQIKQMEKIEDIYLYLIELKKENEELKNRIIALENK